jgi:DNA polymerase III epsilon subunit-like protein
MMTDKDLLFADTETDGLWKQGFGPRDPDQPRPVQIAFARHVPHGQEITASSILVSRADHWRELTQESISIHGITEETRRTGVLPMTAAKTLLDAMEAATEAGGFVTLAGHNVGFDIAVLVAFYYDLGLPEIAERLMGIRTIDTMYMGIDVCKLPPREPGKQGYKRPSLTELHRYLFNEDFDGAHDALVDVRASARCYYKMREMGIPDAPAQFPRFDGGRDPEQIRSVIERCRVAPYESRKEADFVRDYSERYDQYGDRFLCTDKVWSWLSRIAARVAPTGAAPV